MRIKLLSVLVICTCCLGPVGGGDIVQAQTTEPEPSVTAEQEPGNTESQSEEEKAARERAERRREDERKANKDGTVFKPSEEISEDVPAPFPIDI